MKDWVNVDLDDADVIADASALPFKDNSIRAILICHVLEHMPYPDSFECLNEACRVLKDGGAIRIEGPDMLKIIDSYQGHEDVQEMSRHIYGDMFSKISLADCHKSGWTGQMVSNFLSMKGLRVGKVESGTLHKRQWRDFKVLASK